MDANLEQTCSHPSSCGFQMYWMYSASSRVSLLRHVHVSPSYYKHHTRAKPDKIALLVSSSQGGALFFKWCFLHSKCTILIRRSILGKKKRFPRPLIIIRAFLLMTVQTSKGVDLKLAPPTVRVSANVCNKIHQTMMEVMLRMPPWALVTRKSHKDKSLVWQFICLFDVGSISCWGGQVLGCVEGLSRCVWVLMGQIHPTLLRWDSLVTLLAHIILSY